MLRNFDTDEIAEEETVPTVAAYMRKATALLITEEQWTWVELRDYVLSEIEKREGPQVRSTVKEASIFRAFCKRWPTQGVAIAQHVFETCDGIWKGQAVVVTSFCKGYDPYFAQEISAILAR